MKTKEQTSSLGSRLRNLRKERGLTQNELANQAGVSKNAVSLIERGEISPSVSTLQSLAAALEVKMSYFFDEKERTSVIHLKSDDHPTLISQGITIKGIGDKLYGQRVEPFLIALDSYSGGGEQTVIHFGHEFVYCLQGLVEYEIDGNVHSLEKGDILLFDAALPHRWRNPAMEEAEMLVILQTPDGSDEPVRKHFPGYPSVAHIG